MNLVEDFCRACCGAGNGSRDVITAIRGVSLSHLSEEDLEDRCARAAMKLAVSVDLFFGKDLSNPE